MKIGTVTSCPPTVYTLQKDDKTVLLHPLVQKWTQCAKSV